MPKIQRSSCKRFAALTLLLGLSACAGDPIVTNSDVIKRTDQPTVSICYSTETSTEQSLRELALKECPVDTSNVQVWDHDTFMNDCPISNKNRVTFMCLR